MTVITITIADGEDRTVEDDVEVTVSSATPAPTSAAELTPAWEALTIMVGAAMAGAKDARVISGQTTTQESGHVH